MVRRGVTVLLLLALPTLAGCGSSRDAPSASLTSRLVSTPQDGAVLGRSDAPNRLTVFLDLDSYRLTTFIRSDLPELLPGVRRGRLSILFRTTTSESESPENDAYVLARSAQAAGLQDRFWSFLANVAARYAGALDGLTLTELRRGVPQLLTTRAVRDESSPRVTRAVARANELAPRGDRRRGIFVLSGPAGTRVFRGPEPGTFGRSVERQVLGS